MFGEISFWENVNYPEYEIWMLENNLHNVEDALLIYLSSVSILTVFWIQGGRQPLSKDLVTQTSTDFYWVSIGFLLVSTNSIGFLLTFYCLLLDFYWLITLSIYFFWLSTDIYSFLLTFYWLLLTFYWLLWLSTDFLLTFYWLSTGFLLDFYWLLLLSTDFLLHQLYCKLCLLTSFVDEGKLPVYNAV